MKLEIRLYASLTAHLPEKCNGNSFTIETADGTSMEELLDLLNIPIDRPKIMFVNGIHAKLGDVLHDGDTVALFPPIAGG